jgi:hypothetical protein
MATTHNQHDVFQATLQIGWLRALGIGLIGGAIVLAVSGCVRADRGFGTSFFHAVPYAMPSSAVP